MVVLPLNVAAYNPGDAVHFKTEMYSVADSLLHFSALNAPDEWTDTALVLALLTSLTIQKALTS